MRRRHPAFMGNRVSSRLNLAVFVIGVNQENQQTLSHVTKSCIFKNLFLRRKADDKTFQAPKILIKSPKLIGQKQLSYERLLKDKNLNFTFLRMPTFQVFATREFTAKEDLNPQKHGISAQFKTLTRPKSKHLVFFLWKKII